MNRETGLKVVEKVKEVYKDYRQVTIDGVKVLAEDFWFLVRPSGTEPILRIMIEAKTEEKARKLLDHILEIARSVK